MKIKRLTVIILVLAIFAGILISCGDNADNNADGNNNENINAVDAQNGEQQSGETIEETTVPRIEPNLPDEDFGGYMFTFIHLEYAGDDWVAGAPLELTAEEEMGEPVNDAVYRRNMTIMDRYNINIEKIPVADERNALRRAVTAGESLYDAALIINANISSIVTGGLLTSTDDLPFIDLSKPWWDPAVNSLSVANKNFLLGGDALILDNEATNALLFNKELIADLGMELPYSLVMEGKWTMDALNEYIREAAADLNGDGQMTPFDDRFGLLVYNDTLHALLVGGGGTLGLKDNNDMPYWTMMDPRNIAVFERAMGIQHNPEFVLNVHNLRPNDISPAYIQGFEENRALFSWVRMRVVESFRGMEADFGILPMPKFDENQPDYHSVVNPYTGALLGVPKSAENLERVSIILEALAAESRYTLQPAYYDVVLQRKYARDEESSEMLDIIFNSRVYDIGAVYNIDNWISFSTLAVRGDTNLASWYERNEARLERAMENVIAAFEAID